MAKDTKIGWADHTVNFWWGCTKYSEGCKFCYAEVIANRWGKDIFGPTKERERKKAGWKDIIKFDKQARSEGKMITVFVESMSDFLEDHPDLPEMRKEAIPLLENLTNTHVLMLTKRIENAERFLPDWFKEWPEHIWLGTSVENQANANKRIPLLLEVPARIKWLSVEPMLGPISIEEHLPPFDRFCELRGHDKVTDDITEPCIQCGFEFDRNYVDWVVCGGESGPQARPFNISWARDLFSQCEIANVPFFMKQLGSNPIGINSKGKGEDLEDLPEELRVRQFPL